jgi:hypothetical protein
MQGARLQLLKGGQLILSALDKVSLLHGEVEDEVEIKARQLSRTMTAGDEPVGQLPWCGLWRTGREFGARWRGQDFDDKATQDQMEGLVGGCD